jgi:uncharacterized spore protein YtfJ
MDVQEVRQALSDSSNAVSAKRVFGKPYERDGVVVIPAAKVIGGGGGGGGEQGDGSAGAGFGFGLGGQPVGAYVIKNGKVRWKPALDLNAIVLRGQVIAILALLLTRAIAGGRRRRRH